MKELKLTPKTLLIGYSYSGKSRNIVTRAFCLCHRKRGSILSIH